MAKRIEHLVIKRDGNAYICYDGDKFVDLQESNGYYAFGDTPEDALKNYLNPQEEED